MTAKTQVARVLRGMGLSGMVDTPRFRRLVRAPLYRRHLTDDTQPEVVHKPEPAPAPPRTSDTQPEVLHKPEPAPAPSRTSLVAADLRRVTTTVKGIRDLLDRAALHVEAGETRQSFEALAHLVERGVCEPAILEGLALSVGGAADLARRSSVLRMAADKSPGNGQVESLAGDAHYYLTQFDVAADFYRRAREHGYSNERQLYRQANALRKIGDHGAGVHFSAAVAASTSGAVKQFGVAALHEKYDEWELAASEYAANWTALGAQPGTAYRAALAHDRILDWEGAHRWYAAAVSELPEDGHLRYRMALAAERVEAYTEAIESYAYAVTLGAKNAKYCNYRAGVCAYRLGDHDRAFSYLIASYPHGEPLHMTTEGPTHDAVHREDARAALRAESGVAAGVQARAEQHYMRVSRAVELDDLNLAVQELLMYVQATPYIPHARVAGVAKTLVEAGRRNDALRVLLRARKFGDTDGLNFAALTKDRGQRRAALVADLHDREPVQEDLILFESYWGTTVSCHPLAIYRELVHRRTSLRPVWVYQKEAVIPVDVTANPHTMLVEYGTDEYFYFLCVSKYLVNNTSFEASFFRRPEQKFLNTWHGTPLKTLGKSIRSGVLEHDNVTKSMLQATHVISPNEHTSAVLRNEFDISALSEAELLETGSPRLDPLVKGDREREDATKRALGLTDSTDRIVLYAPTWRGSAKDRGMDTERLIADLQAMQSVPGVTVIFRGHHLVEAQFAGLDLGVMLAPRGIDTYELLAISDVLISDYSSLLFDFLATDRCVIAYVPDEEEYRMERGLYFSPRETTSWIARSPEDLTAMIAASEHFTPDEDYRASRQKFAAYEDGAAAGRALDFLTGDLRGETMRAEGETLVTFASMIPNGVTTAYLNLTHSLQSVPGNLVLVVDSAAVRNDPRRASTIDRLPDSVSVVAKVGASAATVRERQALADFVRLRRFTSPRHRELCRNAYIREVRRTIGGWTPTLSLEFEGYSNFWTPLFAMGFPSNPSVVVMHSEMDREIKTRFPYLLTNVAVYSEYDRLAAVSFATAETNRRFLDSIESGLGDRIRVVRNTIDYPSILDRAEEYIPTERAGSPSIVIVGRLAASKNHEALIDAIGILRPDHPEIALNIIGDGPMRESLEAQVRLTGLGDHVNFIGFVENPMPYVKAADAFALPSYHEGQPMVFFEAAVLDKPVLVGDNPGSVEVLNYMSGCVSGHSPGEIAQALRELLNTTESSNFDPAGYQSGALDDFVNLYNELRDHGRTGAL